MWHPPPAPLPRSPPPPLPPLPPPHSTDPVNQNTLPPTPLPTTFSTHDPPPFSPFSLLTRAQSSLAVKSPNYFPHLVKSGPSSVSQMRVAGAPLRGRDRAPRSSMSDPEALSLRSAVTAAPVTPDMYARHTSWSDPTTAMLAGGWGRPGAVAPGVVVEVGGPAVSTPDVPHPARGSIHDPAYLEGVRTRLS